MVLLDQRRRKPTLLEPFLARAWVIDGCTHPHVHIAVSPCSVRIPTLLERVHCVWVQFQTILQAFLLLWNQPRIFQQMSGSRTRLWALSCGQVQRYEAQPSKVCPFAPWVCLEGPHTEIVVYPWAAVCSSLACVFHYTPKGLLGEEEKRDQEQKHEEKTLQHHAKIQISKRGNG